LPFEDAVESCPYLTIYEVLHTKENDRGRSAAGGPIRATVTAIGLVAGHSPIEARRSTVVVPPELSLVQGCIRSPRKLIETAIVDRPKTA
jgi:hypothetical protein